MTPEAAPSSAHHHPPAPAAATRRRGGNQGQFGSLRASSLYCAKCREAKPVRERLLLVLPGKEIYDYLCTACASSVGQREVSAAEKADGPVRSLLVP